MWNTVLFDLDGTLTDSGEGITKCVQYALRKEFNINVDDLHLRVYGHIVADLFDVKAACLKAGAKLRRIRRRITG